MKYTNKYGLPQSLVDVIIGGNYDLSKTDLDRIGITTLIDPPRPYLLKVRHWNELEEDVSNHIWRIGGSAYHYILAKTSQEDRLIETKLEEVVDGITIVGKLDLYDKILKSIEDYKLTSIWAVKFGNPEDYEPQLNSYSWLLRKKGYPTEKAFINALLKDWRRGESLKYDDYPPIPFKRIEVKLWMIEEQEQYVKDRVVGYKKARELTDEELPLCTPEERWAKPDTFAIMKNQNKSATRVLETSKEADSYLKYITSKDKRNSYRIEKREGGDDKCKGYCLACTVCGYWKANYERKKS